MDLIKHRSVYDLNYQLINTRHPRVDQISLCESAYEFWKKSWQSTYNTLGVGSYKLFSDDFLDREVNALFHQGKPVALFFSNWFDVSRPSLLDHSYFKNHPPEVLQFLKEKGFRNVMFLSYMTVHPEWRSHLIDVSMPDLLFSLSIARFKSMGLKALSGYIRTDKSFCQSFYRHGAQKIMSAESYNVPVDFCYLTDDTAVLSPEPGVQEACSYFLDQIL